jgi:hypothetical protein
MAKALITPSEDEAIGILKKLNGNNQAYLVVENSMIQKMGAISYIGNWDMEKLNRWRKREDLETKLVNRDQADEWITQRWAYMFNPQNKQIACSHDALKNSLFTKLYFYKGEGLKHFKLVMNVETENVVVRVYEILF